MRLRRLSVLLLLGSTIASSAMAEIVYRSSPHLVENASPGGGEAPAPASLSVTGTEALSYGQPWDTTITLSGGSGDYSLSLAGELPKGVTQSVAGSVLRLTGRAIEGSYGPFTVTASSGTAASVTSAPFSVAVASASVPLALSNPAPASLTTSGAWNVVVTAEGGLPPYSLDVTGVPTDEGFDLQVVKGDTGVTLTGTAPVGKHGPITVSVEDSVGKSFQGSPFTMTVTPPAGQAYAWGANGSGQRGDSTFTASATLRAISNPAGPSIFSSIEAGNNSGCGTASDGVTYCWGSNNGGEIARDPAGYHQLPAAPIAVPSGLASLGNVKLGQSFGCGIGSDGYAWCWGEHTLGKLGSPGGSTTVPRRVQPPTNTDGIVSVTTGTTHSCGMGTDGQAYCWGSGNNGRLGNNATTTSATPVKVTLPSGVTSISRLTAKGNHTCGIGSDGNVYCWGAATNGALGNGSPNASSVPVKVALLPAGEYRDLTAGHSHTCVTASDDETYCWGRNSAGQLGRGTSNTTTNNAAKVSLNGAKKPLRGLTAGEEHTCGIDADGDAYCWGSNASGQLGSEGNNALTPRKVTLPAGSKKIEKMSAGTIFTLAITKP